MIEYIKGILTYASPLKTIIEAGGIGYCIYTPLSNYSKLPPIGSPLCLYLLTVIREDSQKHYGFLTEQERDLFETLIDVSGIGPKTALALLGHLDPSALQGAISRADVPSICKVPGIGKKTAERLIVEMKDKIQKNSPFPAPITAQVHSGLVADALSALINLGYPAPQVQKTIQSILKEQDTEPDLAQLITLTLKKM